MLGPPSGGVPGQSLPLRLSHQNLQGRRKVLREGEQAHTPQEPPGSGLVGAAATTSLEE